MSEGEAVTVTGSGGSFLSEPLGQQRRRVSEQKVVCSCPALEPWSLACCCCCCC